MGKEYRVLPEQFYHASKLPVDIPDTADDFTVYVGTFQKTILPLVVEVCSGTRSTSLDVYNEQRIGLPPTDHRYG